MATITASARSSSRTTSASAARAMRLWSKNRTRLRRRGSRHRASSEPAPCVTVPQDMRWGRTYEGFSEDPKIVKVLGEAAAAEGWQGADLSDPLSVLACAKHYLADGGTALGTGMGGDSPLDQGDSGSTSRHCVASICRATSPPLPPASAPSCRPTPVGMASKSPAASS